MPQQPQIIKCPIQGCVFECLSPSELNFHMSRSESAHRELLLDQIKRMAQELQTFSKALKLSQSRCVELEAEKIALIQRNKLLQRKAEKNQRFPSAYFSYGTNCDGKFGLMNLFIANFLRNGFMASAPLFAKKNEKFVIKSPSEILYPSLLHRSSNFVPMEKVFSSYTKNKKKTFVCKKIISDNSSAFYSKKEKMRQSSNFADKISQNAMKEEPLIIINKKAFVKLCPYKLAMDYYYN